MNQKTNQFKCIVFDTETTGLPARYTAHPKEWPRLVQLGYYVISWDDRVFAKSKQMVRPEGFEIPYLATKVHGITTEMATAEGFELEKVMTDFGKFWKNCQFMMCHNYKYDIGIVQGEAFRLWDKMPFSLKPHVCTMEQTRNICKLKQRNSHAFKNPKLEELHQFCFNTGFSGAHDALADVDATWRCFDHLSRLGHKFEPIPNTFEFY